MSHTSFSAEREPRGATSGLLVTAPTKQYVVFSGHYFCPQTGIQSRKHSDLTCLSYYILGLSLRDLHLWNRLLCSPSRFLNSSVARLSRVQAIRRSESLFFSFVYGRMCSGNCTQRFFLFLLAQTEWRAVLGVQGRALLAICKVHVPGERAGHTQGGEPEIAMQGAQRVRDRPERVPSDVEVGPTSTPVTSRFF